MTQTSTYTCDICPAQGFPVGDETYPPGWVLVSIRSHYKKQVDDLDLCPVCAKGLAKAVRALTVNPPTAASPPQQSQPPTNTPVSQPTTEAPPDVEDPFNQTYGMWWAPLVGDAVGLTPSDQKRVNPGLPEVAYEQPEKKS